MRSERSNKPIDAILAHQCRIAIVLKLFQFVHQIFYTATDFAVRWIGRLWLAGFGYVEKGQNRPPLCHERPHQSTRLSGHAGNLRIFDWRGQVPQPTAANPLTSSTITNPVFGPSASSASVWRMTGISGVNCDNSSFINALRLFHHGKIVIRLWPTAFPER